MRFVHTSDWHIGRTLANESLQSDQEHLLNQVFEAVGAFRADALIIAGDIFDRAAPRKEAIALFNDFLRRVYLDTDTSIIAIAGNHDAPERVAFNNALQDPRRVLIRGPLADGCHPLILADDYGPVAISALPYAEIYSAREAFASQSIASPAEVIAAQMAAASAHVPTGARWVVTAHAFVEGAATTESERPLTMVGGIETVPATVFNGASYVALGHLHRAQSAGAPHIRYSGAWMGYGFDEFDDAKSLSLVEINGTGHADIRTYPLTSLRPLAVITGTIQDLLAEGRGWPEEKRQALIKAVLTDEGALVDAIGQLRAVFPFVLQLERVQRATPKDSFIAKDIDRRDPRRVIHGFLDFVRGIPPNDEESKIVDSILHDLLLEEA